MKDRMRGKKEVGRFTIRAEWNAKCKKLVI
jgi:hypothetical protein